MYGVTACVIFALACATVPVWGKLAGPNPYIPTRDGDVEDFALKQVSSVYDGLEESAFKILGGTMQIVNGVLYNLRVQVSTGNEEINICSVSVWNRVWLEKDFINQLKDKVTCGVPEEVAKDIEKDMNMKTNNLFYATLTNQPTLKLKEGTVFDLTNALFTETNCSKDSAAGFLEAKTFDENCKANENAKSLAKCSATVTWNQDSQTFSTSNILCGNA